jgi:hypothetical protein
MAAQQDLAGVTVEIGFYDEDLPRLIRDILVAAEDRSNLRSHDGIATAVIPKLGLELSFETLFRLNRRNRDLGDPNEPVLVPFRTLRREAPLRAAIDDLTVPFEDPGVVQPDHPPP